MKRGGTLRGVASEAGGRSGVSFLGARLARKGRGAREHLVQRGADGPDVGRGPQLGAAPRHVGGVAGELLGRGVGRSLKELELEYNDATPEGRRLVKVASRGRNGLVCQV